MQKLYGGRWWLAALLLAVGCRSEQAAFSFRPATRAVAAPVPVAPASSAARPLMAPAGPALRAATPLAVPHAPAAPAAPAEAAARPGSQRLKHAVVRFRQPVDIRAARPETAARATRTDTLHWVLGAALVVAGVVGGLLLGGWLGLGVGAALVLLGYYFVLKALGGQQAWLEVFQEFFNM